MMEFVVIVEAEADFIIATKLAERVLREQAPEWLQDLFEQQELFDENLLPFKWTGLEPNTEYSRWTKIGDIIKAAKLPAKLGWGKDGYLKTDGVNTFKLLHLVRRLRRTQDIRAVILIRDQDNQPERRQHIEAARDQGGFANLQPSLEMVVGICIPEREAWVLNGFEAKTEVEQKRLDELKNKLKFDPCRQAHRLRGSNKESTQQDRDIKTVLRELTDGVFERERQCWEETSLAVLRDRGEETGLRAYLKDVEALLTLIVTE